MIHISKIKKNNSRFKNKRARVNKTSTFHLKLPQIPHARTIVTVVGFIMITLVLLGSVSVINSQSFDTQAGAGDDSVRVITNFYYDQNKSNEFEAIKIKSE